MIRARLPAEEGAVVLRVLEAALEAQCPAENESEDTNEGVTAETLVLEYRYARRRADALDEGFLLRWRHTPSPNFPTS